jgi:hypothetical protein
MEGTDKKTHARTRDFFVIRPGEYQLIFSLVLLLLLLLLFYLFSLIVTI